MLFKSFNLLLVLALLVVAASAQSIRVEGVVRDSTGAVVAGAAVTLQAGSFAASGKTDAAGKFFFDSVSASSGVITVHAKNFADLQQNWNAGPDSFVKLQLFLALSSVNEEVVVTATRTEARLSELAVSALSLSTPDLDATPALVVDDKLRQIPGFTLFRRSGSRTANPTSQGVSLSGLGASGASRAVVMEDGVPLTDPFGGWVYWGRVPQEGIESIEVVRRGMSSLYGSDGLGGAIQFRTRQAQSPAFSLETSYGSEQTPALSFWGGETFGPWNAAIATDLLRTDGYILVPPTDRGTVDTAANTEHADIDLTVGRSFGDHTRVFGRGSYFTESRNNGTVLQVNDTQIGQAVLGADAQPGNLGSFSFRLFGQAQAYGQSFTAVPVPNTGVNRDSEALTNLQHVLAQQVGGSGWWSKALGLQTFVAGLDVGEVMGWSNESTFSAVTAAHTANTVAGGRQRTLGVYGQDILRITPRWILTAGGRFDYWRNFDASLFRTPFTPPGASTLTPFAERSENAFSPRVSLLYQVAGNVSLSASAYRAFRAPTLNELYRSFRVGNVVTGANSELEAERLTGGEAGANIFALDRKLNLRGNFFWDDIVDPIANVTLNQNSSPIQRQRQNLGRTRSRGVELDAALHLPHTIEISGGYQLVNAKVVSFPADPANNPSLEGNFIPQIPRNQFTLQARYWNPSRLMFSVQGRFVGNQFDDDINTFLLDRYFTMDILAGRAFRHGVEVFGALENITNQRYIIAKSPTPNVGPPILARIGVRFNFPSR